MNEINKEELFGNLKGFLKAKGVELQEDGAYTQHIKKGCEILTDSVNLSQRGFERAKSSMERGLDQLRQTIHERTAPKSETPPPQPKSAASQTDARAKTKPQAAKATSKGNKAGSTKSRGKRSK